MVPVHTAEEIKLFKSMLNSGGFYKELKGKQPIAAHLSRTVDFTKMAQEWTFKVHEAAAENNNSDKAPKVYYKLPEQLEKYHQSWVQRRGENATLTNTVNMCLPITKLLSNPKRQAKVLPAIEFPQQIPQSEVQTSSAVEKGKQKEVESSAQYMDVNMNIDTDVDMG